MDAAYFINIAIGVASGVLIFLFGWTMGMGRGMERAWSRQDELLADAFLDGSLDLAVRDAHDWVQGYGTKRAD